MRDAVIAKAISDYEKRKRQAEEISVAIEGLGDSEIKIDYPVFQKRTLLKCQQLKLRNTTRTNSRKVK